MDDQLNTFGGFWTKQKIQIFLKYLKAYLDIMNRYNFKLIYFDGFAGSGKISYKEQITDSVAIEVLSSQHKKSFDIYYLVELEKAKAKQLEKIVQEQFPEKQKVYVVNADCNEKLSGMADFLKKNKSYRALAFVDPFGMALNWSTLEECKKQGIDLWILVPTGIGVNRLLTSKGKISEAWIRKLETFLGLKSDEIKKYFYKEMIPQSNLFGTEAEIHLYKERNAIRKIAELYCKRLGELWKHVSHPFPLKNKSGSVMFHFVLATNSPAGLKIANEIIGKM